MLAEHFLAKFCAREGKATKRLSAAVLERLEAHPWRGNVRELAHAIEMLVLFSDADEIGLEDLPRALRQDRAAGAGVRAAQARLPRRSRSTSASCCRRRSRRRAA